MLSEDVLEAVEQVLDALQHGVEAVGEAVELVAAAGHLQPAGQVAAHDRAARGGQRIDAFQHAPADEHPGQRRQGDHQRQGPGQCLRDDVAELLALAEVAADQHVVATGQVDELDKGEMVLALAGIPLVADDDGIAARVVQQSLGDVGDIAGERMLGGVGNQIEAGAGLAAAGLDGVDKTGQPAAARLIGKAGQVGGDRLAQLLGEHFVGGIGDVDDEGDGEDREDRDIDRRQLECGGADDLTERRHGSCIRRRGRYAGAARRSPCRSWRAGARHARRSRWSADRSDSPRRSRAAWCG